MNVKKLITLPLGVLLVFASCHSSQKLNANTAIVVVDMDQKNSPDLIKIKLSDTLYLSMEGNVTTGFNWYSSVDSNNEVLRLIDEKYKTTNTTPGIVGAPSIKTFIYKAQKTGTETVVLEYYRGWEKGTTPVSSTKKIVVEIVEK